MVLDIVERKAGRRGTVVSLHTAALDLGAVLGTPLCGLLAERAGFPAMFKVMAVACLAGLVPMAVDPAWSGRRMVG